MLCPLSIGLRKSLPAVQPAVLLSILEHLRFNFCRIYWNSFFLTIGITSNRRQTSRTTASTARYELDNEVACEEVLVLGVLADSCDDVVVEDEEIDAVEVALGTILELEAATVVEREELEVIEVVARLVEEEED